MRVDNNRKAAAPAAPKKAEAPKPAKAPAQAAPAKKADTTPRTDSFKAKQPATNPFKGAQASGKVATPGKALKSGKTDFNPQAVLGLGKKVSESLTKKVGSAIAKAAQSLAESTKPQKPQAGPLA